MCIMQFLIYFHEGVLSGIAHTVRIPLVPTPRGSVNLAQRERELALQAAMFNMNNPAAQGLSGMDRRLLDLEQQSIRIQSHQLMLRQQALQRQQQACLTLTHTSLPITLCLRICYHYFGPAV